jgi:hypothetical protein
MSSSLSGDHKGCAAGFIRLHVRGLRSHQWLIARAVVCATGAVHTNIFRSASVRTTIIMERVELLLMVDSSTAQQP